MSRASREISVGWLLNAMFPGDITRGMPSFQELGADAIARVSSEAAEFSAWFLSNSQEIEFDCDINHLLKNFRKIDPSLTHHFITVSIETYFSHPSVLLRLLNGKIEIFPNTRTLPDFDFNLLEPVLEQFERVETNE